MAFPCHLLNLWRSPILLWQPQQRGSSLEPHTPQSNSTQAHPNPHSLERCPQLDPQLDRAQAPLLANPLHAQLTCDRGSEVNVVPPTVVSSGLGRRSLEGPANGCVNLNWNLPSNSLCSMRRLVLQNLMSIHLLE
ncbi:unnamed protein product [Microthlaspi erraticum]|uniref:Uncharacterized protein n=1 Tax=Microthlaspi erraticum TaxID=1685480 RepID=A0A6D2I273_9BRAS|nr:unnamed protein product [Microthlaspi erraticum]